MSTSSSTSAFASAVGGDVKALYTLITGAASISSLTSLNTQTKANLVAAINEVLTVANQGIANTNALIKDTAPGSANTYSSNKIEAVATAKGQAAALALISDGTTSASLTWSSTQINTAIGAVATQVQNILAGSTAAYDTFKEVSDYIAADQTGASAMLASIQQRLQLDADTTFTANQLTHGLNNLVALGAAKQSDLQALVTAVGDTTINFVTVYTNAKNS